MDEPALSPARKYTSWLLQAVALILILYGFLLEKSLPHAVLLMASGALIGFGGAYLGSVREMA